MEAGSHEVTYSKHSKKRKKEKKKKTVKQKLYQWNHSSESKGNLRHSQTNKNWEDISWAEILKGVLQAKNCTVISFLTYQIGQTSQVFQHTILVRLWGKKQFHMLLMGMKNSAFPIQVNIAISNNYIHIYTLTSNSMSKNLPSKYISKNKKIHMHRAIHCSIICNYRILKKPNCSYIGDWLNKLQYIYTIGYAAVKPNEEDLCKLKCRDFSGYT